MNQAEEIFVKVKIHYPFSVIVSERVWAQEQEFDWVDSDTIIFSARLQGRQEIIGWILSMGNLAEVLEPADLVEDISREIKLIARKY